MGATFTWSEPLHKGGRTLTGYRIEAREADPDSNFSRTVNVSGATTTSGEVTGPTNDTTYQGLAGVHAKGVDPSDLVRAVERGRERGRERDGDGDDERPALSGPAVECVRQTVCSLTEFAAQKGADG